ncbi:ribonuclease H [Paenibacillus sp. NPDC058071]|uniref:ribonuclease H n=1 Tax=Paenibacillus sp. NPDC058071 TaxID=3346326 RepID=UPI0036D82B78
MAGKHYVVWVGKQPGIYAVWKDCQEQVNGYPEAKYKSFASKQEAEKAFRDGWQRHWGKGSGGSTGGGKTTTAKAATSYRSKAAAVPLEQNKEIDYDSISVDVGTHGNPGPVEYKGVDTQTGEVLFYVGPIPNGTNNLGEFIAVVHALDYLHKQGSGKTIYSDSRTALAWIRNRKIASTLKRDESTKRIWELADWALNWLNSHPFTNRIEKWNTEEWGEIRADFGRK